MVAFPYFNTIKIDLKIVLLNLLRGASYHYEIDRYKYP